jgi:hypothetical protein
MGPLPNPAWHVATTPKPAWINGLGYYTGQLRSRKKPPPRIDTGIP